MDSFDLSAPWVILAPWPVGAAAEDLARCIGVLRQRDSLGGGLPPVKDGAGPAPEDSVPIILLNEGGGGNERGGFSWRTGRDRVEIYGDSRRGLCNGVYAFLAALGFSWPAPDRESLPPAGGAYPLTVRAAYSPSDPSPENRRRLVIPPKTPLKRLSALGRWAARNRVDALIFSLGDRRIGGPAAELEDRWGLIIERGGWDMGLLAPRRLFFFNRELFRMEGGRRVSGHHFCPTNPQSIELLWRRLDALLEAMDKAAPVAADEAGNDGTRARPRIYHLWPDRGAEHRWCACPACRAFSPREQIRLAVNAAADLIGKRDRGALISCRGEEEPPGEKLPGGSEITLRPNVFRLRTRIPADGPGEPLVYYCDGGVIRELR
ncbi:MAG: hypothetical protein LBQ46_10570 [Treponema sp.]|jgi:hypothetical protein|nr:hypothetical protein [Treponema sp.]